MFCAWCSKQSIILCQSLFNNENLETFNWFFKCLKSAVSDSPKVIMSDHDLALESAIEQQFPGTKHFLCLFHIYQNLNRNVKPKL